MLKRLIETRKLYFNTPYFLGGAKRLGVYRRSFRSALVCNVRKTTCLLGFRFPIAYALVKRRQREASVCWNIK